MIRKLLVAVLLIILFCVLGSIYSDITSPYGKWSIVKPFFTTSLDADGQISLHQVQKIYFVKNPFFDFLTYVQRAFRPLLNAHFSEVAFTGTEDDIIQSIHTERFDITKPYVISGAHFAEFYVRNFGLFYSAILDPRFGYSQDEWVTRERVTLQTLAAHLALLQESGKEYTTFVPMWSNVFTGIAVYTDPSDSLFAVYYTLGATVSNTFITDRFPSQSVTKYPLQTQRAGKQLLTQYAPILKKVTQTYLDSIIDSKTGVIRTDITLSSARDGIKRQSSFYDNVVAWSTVDMARTFGIDVCPARYRVTLLASQNTQQATTANDCDLISWKQTIITAFWDDKAGIFLDDLSTESKKNHLTSGDVFITTSTRFLNLNNTQERTMIERQIQYVQAHNLDKPFPLRYAIHDQPDRLYWPVYFFVPSYMGETIWSHWGMEYLKTLMLLSPYDSKYLTFAQQGMDAYKQNIIRFGGYPELYDTHGNMYQTPFYKSILHTGWVVNYEQARMMLQSLGK